MSGRSPALPAFAPTPSDQDRVTSSTTVVAAAIATHIDQASSSTKTEPPLYRFASGCNLVERISLRQDDAEIVYIGIAGSQSQAGQFHIIRPIRQPPCSLTPGFLRAAKGSRHFPMESRIPSYVPLPSNTSRLISVHVPARPPIPFPVGRPVLGFNF